MRRSVALAGLALAGLALATVTGCQRHVANPDSVSTSSTSAFPPPTLPSSTFPRSTATAPRPHTPSPRSGPASSHGTTPQAGDASALLATLTIKGRAPMTGYSRAQFGQAWTDDNGDLWGHNGCDTRDDILRRDLVDLTIKPDTNGCVAAAGLLHDPYTGATIRFLRGSRTSQLVPIDHVVALGDAWQMGAQQWTPAKRVDLANDPLNLLAVDQASNDEKGDSDAASWLPANKSYRCAYVARQVAVKARYGLAVTQAEHDAIARVLSGCPSTRLPVDERALVARGQVP